MRTGQWPTAYGLVTGARGSGIAFHVGNGVFVTAAHCVQGPPGRLSLRFGVELWLRRTIPPDCAILDGPTLRCSFSVAPYAIEPGRQVGFTCLRSGIARGEMEVTCVQPRTLIARPIGKVRPVPGDSGAPVCVGDSRRLIVGLICGATGPGLLQDQIVIQRLQSLDVAAGCG